jgi:hypothetical protein
MTETTTTIGPCMLVLTTFSYIGYGDRHIEDRYRVNVYLHGEHVWEDAREHGLTLEQAWSSVATARRWASARAA